MKNKVSSILILLISFLFYAFNQLGSTTSPLTYKTYNYANVSTQFEFKNPSTVDEVCYYMLINKDIKFNIKNKRGTQWKNFYEHNTSFPFSFQWICASVKPTPVKKLKMTTTQGQMMLAEIRFRYKGNDINFSSSYPKLNDEPHIAVNKNYYNGSVFDEIYHPRTAYEIMKNVFPIYENTHPYLGKLLIIPGIKLFDMTPFGWRFTNVIFGAIFILIAYLFTLKLFQKPFYATVSSFLMSYSFMHLTQSRLGLIDTFGVLFVFISYYFLYRFIKKQILLELLLSGLFFGLAAAVKWSAIFASFGFMFIAFYLLITHYPLKKSFSGYRLILYGFLSYGIFGIFIYALSFYDLYLKTHSLQSIIDYQVHMYSYHTHIAGSHPYSSKWWSWPLDIKPMNVIREIKNGQFSSINIFGNPAIFFMGIPSLFYLLYIFIKRRTLEASFIFLAFSSLYFPYIFVGRYMFIYHYYYAVPFLILAIVYGIKDFLSYYPKYSILLWIYLSIVAGLFLAFYPVLTGYEVPKSYVDNFLIWFPSWWL